MAKKQKNKKYRKFWWFVRFQVFLAFLILGAVGYYYYSGYARQVTNLKNEADQFVQESDVNTFRAIQTSIIYDKNGNQITTVKGEKDVYYLTYEQIPAKVREAIISIEDKKFYQHHGIDYKAIFRAIKAMIQNGQVTQGASTITQQLARTMFLSPEKTWQRKVEEMFIALDLEEKYNKEQILEFYLNNIYFGNGYYGIQAASMGYFSKKADELDLSEAAFLCAIPNNPTVYNPLTNEKNTLTRRNKILLNMYNDQKIKKSDYQQAALEDMQLQTTVKQKNNYVETYVYNCTIRALMQNAGFVFRYDFDTEADQQAYQDYYDSQYSEYQKKLYTGGYRVYTSIDLSLQETLQSAIDDNLSDFTEVNDEGIYKLQGAGVCIDNSTGYVAAVVGGRSQDYNGYTLNRAYQSYRQPGSAIKPLIVYTPSLERGYTPDSIVEDAPIENGPTNADGSYAGKMTLRTALAKSKNTIAWKLFEELTPQVGLSYLKEMNFARISKEDYRPTSALGGFTNGVSPVEMASGYAAIENDGNFRAPTCVVRITDADGNEVLATGQIETKVYRSTASRVMTDMLQTVIKEGTGKGLGLTDMVSAGKTGTTNDNKDGWFVGFTPYYTTSVWVGYDMPQKLPGLSGATYPGKIWHAYMEKIHKGLAEKDFLKYIEVPEDTTDSSDSTAVDGSTVQDQGTNTDNAAPQDNVTAPDAGAADAAVTPDAGATPDAGTTPDAQQTTPAGDVNEAGN